jgi:zinc transporter ZupT
MKLITSMTRNINIVVLTLLIALTSAHNGAHLPGEEDSTETTPTTENTSNVENLNSNAGVAIGLSFISTIAICLGATFPFVPSILKREESSKLIEQTTFMAGTLSFTAGILLYSTMSALVPETFVYLVKSSIPKAWVYAVGVTYFLVGALSLQFVNKTVDWLTPDKQKVCVCHVPTVSNGTSTESKIVESKKECPQFCDSESTDISNVDISDGENTNQPGNHSNIMQKANYRYLGIQTAIAMGVHKIPEGTLSAYQLADLICKFRNGNFPGCNDSVAVWSFHRPGNVSSLISRGIHHCNTNVCCNEEPLEVDLVSHNNCRLFPATGRVNCVWIV